MNNQKITKKSIEEFAKLMNDLTFDDYFNRLSFLALNMFEWINLPKSMNQFELENSLFLHGEASILFDENFGFINTNCSGCGNINIYSLPTKLTCFSHEYRETRLLYTGLTDLTDKNNCCILVQNNWKRIPTVSTIELFAHRLANAERICDINLNAMKTPILILTSDKQKFSLENTYLKYDGNIPVIYANKDTLDPNSISVINTQADFICDKIINYKKEILNDALTFLGINNIITEKKERLISDEANTNNELINLNLQRFLAPRQYACNQFNDFFGFSGTDKEISVRVRSDLHNIIKNVESIVNDYNNINDIDKNIENLKEGE